MMHGSGFRWPVLRPRIETPPRKRGDESRPFGCPVLVRELVLAAMPGGCHSAHLLHDVGDKHWKSWGTSSIALVNSISSL